MTAVSCIVICFILSKSHFFLTSPIFFTYVRFYVFVLHEIILHICYLCCLSDFLKALPLVFVSPRACSGLR